MKVFQRQLSNFDESRPCGSNKRSVNRYSSSELKTLVEDGNIHVPVSAPVDIMCTALRASKMQENRKINNLNRLFRGDDYIQYKLKIEDVLDENNFFIENYAIAEKLLPVPEEIRCFQSLYSRTFDLTISNTIDFLSDQKALINYRLYVDKLISKLLPFGTQILSHPPLLQKLYLRLLISIMILYPTKYEIIRPTLTDVFLANICPKCPAFNISNIITRSEMFVERMYRRVENTYSNVNQNFLVDLYSNKKTKLGNHTFKFQDLLMDPIKNIHILLPLPYNLVQIFSTAEQERLIATAEMFARVNLSPSCVENVKKLFEALVDSDVYRSRIWACSILLQQKNIQEQLEQQLQSKIDVYEKEVIQSAKRIQREMYKLQDIDVSSLTPQASSPPDLNSSLTPQSSSPSFKYTPSMDVILEELSD